MGRRICLVLLTATLAILPLYADGEEGSSVSFSNFEFPWYGTSTSYSGNTFETIASSDGSFSFSYLPEINFGKISMQFDIRIAGVLTTDPFDVTFDFSDWTPPERKDDESTLDYATKVAKHYSRFISSVQYGERFDTFYIRYGKLIDITLGDGALLNGYFDKSVPVRVSRPGLEVMVDGQLLGLKNSGFQFVINDMFAPTLTAWRVYGQPITDFGCPVISSLQVGISLAHNPGRLTEQQAKLYGRELLAMDFSLPVLTWEHLNLSVFADVLLQGPEYGAAKPAVAFRYGLWGHSKSFFVFNASVTVPTFGTYHADYFSSDFETRTEDQLAQQVVPLGTTRLDGMFSISFVRQQVFFRTRMIGNYTDGIYHDYRFLANLRIEKQVFNIVSLDLSYEKLYPTSTGERFVEGLQTLKNVNISAAAVIKFKPYSFNIGLDIEFDEQAGATFKVDTAVRFAIF